MKKVLVVEYKNKNFKKVYKVEPGEEPWMIGTSRNAHVRVSGSDVSPYHSGLEYRNDDWYIFDMVSQSGTWIQKDSVVDQKITDDMEIKLGEHSFKFKVVPENPGYYNLEERRNIGSDLHEVVIKVKNKIIETIYLDKNESFLYHGAEGIKPLAAPNSNRWITTQFGHVTVLQRLIGKHRPVEKTNIFGKWSVHYHIYTGLGVFMLILAYILYPKEPQLTLPENVQQNRYNRILYDSKLVQEKRKQSQEIKQSSPRVSQKQAEAKGDGDGRAQGQEAKAYKGASQKAVKAISQIKASGLQNLLGKIASRANINTNTIQVNAGGTGKGTSSQVVGFGSASTGQGIADVKESGQSVGLGKVGTEGKGGGGTGYKGMGQLAQGGIGQAQVGMLEEEADISGGMDKDAIAEVIRRNIGQIRFCYERRLSAVPNLFGKVLVQFSIADGGTVLLPKVAQSTLSDSVVEGCILRRIASWKFPSPPAGTSVLVTYPFLFKSTQ